MFTGRTWEARLVHGSTYSIGRARENDIVLDDRRVSRKHAFIFGDGTVFKVIDGHLENANLPEQAGQMTAIREKVYAAVYLGMSLRGYAKGDWAQAQDALTKAIKHAPSDAWLR